MTDIVLGMRGYSANVAKFNFLQKLCRDCMAAFDRSLLLDVVNLVSGPSNSVIYRNLCHVKEQTLATGVDESGHSKTPKEMQTKLKEVLCNDNHTSVPLVMLNI